jgi:hypothetical protein
MYQWRRAWRCSESEKIKSGGEAASMRNVKEAMAGVGGSNHRRSIEKSVSASISIGGGEKQQHGAVGSAGGRGGSVSKSLAGSRQQQQQ